MMQDTIGPYHLLASCSRSIGPVSHLIFFGCCRKRGDRRSRRR